MGKENMKRHGHLWERITSDENIRLGIVNACRSRNRKTPAKKRNILYTKQQFTAFKPLAHRPKPMLAKP